MVLLILGAVWAAVLVPPALRARAEASPGDTIGSFHHQLNVLRRTGGYIPRPGFGEHGPVPVPRSSFGPGGIPIMTAAPVDSVRRRRRDVLVTLLWIMGATLALGLMPSFRGLLVLHLVADALFVGYVLLLRHIKLTADTQRAEQAAKVRRLRPVPDGVADLALRRAASR
ncbi:MAG: hypothetical protein HYU28_08645 [Actinobacteria bacterium]|nr:hypothetical protein [Actinomycetota bacterium]